MLGGVLVFVYFSVFGESLYRRNPEHLANRVEVAGLFWHFVDLDLDLRLPDLLSSLRLMSDTRILEHATAQDAVSRRSTCRSRMPASHGASRHASQALCWVGIALILFTAFTVLLSYVDFGSMQRNMVIGMLVATFKVSLVGGDLHALERGEVRPSGGFSISRHFSSSDFFCSPGCTGSIRSSGRPTIASTENVAQELPYCLHRPVDPAGGGLRGLVVRQ